LFIVNFLNGCDEGTQKQRMSLLGEDTTKVNPNGLAYLSAQKSQNLKNKLQRSKIEADAKIEIAKIETEGKLKIAKIHAKTEQEKSKSDSLTKITTSKLDAKTKKESMHYMVYIAVAMLFFLTIAIVLLYLNSKKNRELQSKLHEEKLRHEQALHEKELEEKRLHKILDLAAAGKLPSSIEEEVILSISAPKNSTMKL
jgi:preprotein translocase subunit SecG